MAYAEYIKAQHVGADGAPHEAVIEKDGFGGTPVEVLASVPPYTLRSGGQSDDVLLALRSNQLAARLISQEAAHLDPIRAIQSERSRNYRLGASWDGGEIFKGYCLTDFIATGLIDEAAQVCTVTAKDRLKSLDQPWLDSSGEAFNATDPDRRIAFSVVIAEILSHLDLGLPLRCVMAWRSAGMLDTDDPLGVLLPAAPFYEEDEDGYLKAETRLGVLEEILRLFHMQLVQARGAGDVLAWHLVQPAAFRDAGVGAQVREFRYDSTGAFQTSVLRDADVDYGSVWWLAGSDEGKGRQAIRSASGTYFYGGGGGALERVFRNGAFNWWEDPDADGFLTPKFWTLNAGIGDTEIEKGGGSGVGANPSLRFAGRELDLSLPGHDSEEDFIDNWAEQTLPVVQDEEGPLLLMRGEVRGEEHDAGGAIQTLFPLGEYRLWYAVYVDGATNDYYYDQDTDSWALIGATTEHEQRTRLVVDPTGAPQWAPVSLDLPPIPDTGDLRVRIFNGVGELAFTRQDPYEIWTLWDDIRVFFPPETSSDESGSRSTTYQEYDGFVTEGGEQARSFRIGDGPFADSAGALHEPDGTPTGSWKARSSDVNTYVLTRLWAREMMRLRRRGQPTMRFTSITEPDGTGRAASLPLYTTAIQYDGALWWPVSVSYDGGYGSVEIMAVRLDDFGAPADSAEVERRDSEPPEPGGGGIVVGTGGGADKYVASVYRNAATGDMVLAMSDGTTRSVPAWDSQLATYLSQHNPLTETSADVAAGDITALPVEQRPGSALKNGDTIIVVRADTGEPLVMSVTADEPAEGFTSIPVSTFSLASDLPAGSGVYWASRDLVLLVREHETQITQNASDIDTLAGYLSQHNPLTLTSAEHAAGDLSILNVNAAGEPVLKAGNRIVVIDEANGHFMEMEITADETTDDASLEVGDPADPTQPVTLSAPIAAGSGVYFGHRALLDLRRAQGDEIDALEGRISDLESGSGRYDIAQGTATVLSGTSSVTVDTGAPRDIQEAHIQITSFSAEHGWPDPASFAAASFDIALSTAAGADRLFSWRVMQSTPPNVPQNLAVEAMVTMVTLSWRAVSDPDGYIVYWDTEPGGGTDGTYSNSEQVTLGELSDPSNPEWTVDGLTTETTYYFVVTSYREQ